jgi:hypothetical protein
MKAYLITTGSLFGVLTVVHVWRVVEEGAHLAAAAALCLWAWRLLRRAARP